MARQLSYIQGASDVFALKNNCGRMLAAQGKEAGDGTQEMPVRGEFTVILDRLAFTIGQLEAEIEPALMLSSEPTFAAAMSSALAVAKHELGRDPLSRQAVAISESRVPYQNFWLRDGFLYAQFHQGDVHINEMGADFWYMLRAIKAVREKAVPAGYELKGAYLRWACDCLYKGARQAAVEK